MKRGRGKDQYRDWDAVVTISEPVINIDAVVSICNARAMRDVKRAGAAATVDMLAYIPRVQPDQMARVVIDDRTGTIVMGENVRISTVAIAQGNLSLSKIAF